MIKDKNIEKLLENYRIPSVKSKEEAWKHLSAKLESEQEKTFRFDRLLQIAAVLAVAIVFTVLADSFVFVQKYSSGFREQKIITLKDDSKVTLNPNSRLSVNYSFITGKRKLKLEGYALFDVEKGREFSVEFNGGKVVVVGTRFSVEAYRNIEPEINCLLGSVKVKIRKEQMLLEPQEGVAFSDNSKIKKMKINEEKVLAEMNGNYSWENERLSNIFKILEAQFGYQVVVPKEIKNRKFTGTVNLKDIKHSLEVLSFAMDLNYSIDEQNNVLTFENNE